MKKVFICGGAGFIGQAVTESLLATGAHIHIADKQYRLDRLPPMPENVSLSPYHFSVDVFPQEILKGYDALIHLAWTTVPSSSMKSVSYDAKTNIVSSLDVFDSAVNCGVERIIFSSSGGTVYGNPDRLPVSENSKTQPQCAYGASKLAVEHYLSVYDKINGVSLRIGNPYGAYQFIGTPIGVIARFLLNIKNNMPIQVWGSGDIVRDYLSVEEVAKAFTLAVTSDSITEGPYNIGSGRGTSLNELISVIFEVTQLEVPVKYRPSRGYDVQSIVLDSAKFAEATGWTATPDSLKKDIGNLWLALQDH